MKEIIRFRNKKTRIALIVILTIISLVAMLIFTKLNRVSAATKTCGDPSTFGNLIGNANDGDVIKLTNNLTLGQEGKVKIKSNCLVTLDLNNHSITYNVTDAFDIGANSALLITNGSLNLFDTANTSSGIVILNNVTVSNQAWLGQTMTWVVNNSYINLCSTEQGSINSGASNLHPVGPGADVNPYNYNNFAPAMIGSGTRWTIYSDLITEFNTVNNNSSIYNNIILLNNTTLSSNINLSASGVTLDFSNHSIVTDNYLKISNSSGTNIIRNGTINGNIDMTTGSGNISISNMTITGDINNGTHNININGGTYNNISGGRGKVTITDGYFNGTFTGNAYEISGGYFANQPNPSSIKEGFAIVASDLNAEGTLYRYQVVPKYQVIFDTNGHGTNPEIQDIPKGEKATRPRDPTADNYTFDGWYRENTCINAYDFNSAINSNTTVYAKWIPAIYDVTLNCNGGTINSGNVIKYTYSIGTKLPTEVTKPKYTFDGWYENDTITGEPIYEITTTDSGNKTYYAKWKLNIITDSMVDISNNVKTFDGTEYSINVTNSIDASIKYGTTEGIYDLDYLPKYKDVGTYTIYYKIIKDNYADRTGKATLVINPADISTISFDNNEYTYDGQGHTIKVLGELIGGTIKYGTTEGTYDFDEIPKYTDVGTYTIYYKATKDNYFDKTGFATIQIKPRPITVKAKDKIINYGDDTPVFDYEVTSGSLVPGNELSNINVSQLVETNVGIYTITISQTTGSNSNYEIVFENGTYTINKREIVPDIILNQNIFKYNSKEQKPIVSVKYNEKDLPTSEYSVEFTEESTNIGNKQIRVLSKNENYIFDEVIKDYVINPKTIDSDMVTIEKHQYAYDTKMKTPIITVKNGDVLLEKDKDYDVLDTSTTTAKDVGNYNIVIRGKGNYSEEYTILWSIVKSRIPGVKIEGVDTTYDGKEYKIDVTIPNNAEISYKTSINSEYSKENPKFKNAGNYTVYYKIEVEDSNYETIENYETVCIKPKKVQVTADDKEKIYGEADPELTYTAKGLVGKEKLEGITLTRKTGEDTGTYIITASSDSSKDMNYNIILSNGAFKINKKELKKPKIIVTTNNIVYTGNNIEPKIILKDNSDNIIPDSEYKVSYENNINAGEATIIITDKVSGNYSIDGRTTFTIEPKVLINPKIEFDQTEYKYTGNQIEPEIIIKDDNVVISPDEYIASYTNNKNEGMAKVLVISKKDSNYKFSLTSSYRIVRPGDIQVVNSRVPNVNDAKLSESSNDLFSKIYFTDEELEKHARGNNINIYLEVTDISENVSTEEEQLIIKKVTGNVGAFFDVNLFKKIAGEDATKITNTKEPISITFDIPEKLINHDSNIKRTYSIARLHKGVVTLLNTTVEENRITFETDEFSTYAIIYSDENVSGIINDVVNKINLIDMTKLIGSKAHIVSTRDSYEALTEEQKELVTNYEILVNAEIEYNRLYNQAISNIKK